ncbi:MAG: Maf-like protein [Alphaproteobacteria bacterium]|nr:Maf-like protein [Alphaproteobacteria bacterium]
MSRLVLASGSPARARLLAGAGVPFTVQPARVDEETLRQSLTAEGIRPREIADALAELKAMRVSAQVPDALVLGCDQLLLCEGRIFAKPEGRAGAEAQLRALAGRTHELITAQCIALAGSPIWRHVETPRLTMRALSEPVLAAYLDAEGDSVLSSVGAYLIEGRGVQLFERIEGSLFTVQGLALLPLLAFLRQHGVVPP